MMLSKGAFHIPSRICAGRLSIASRLNKVGQARAFAVGLPPDIRQKTIVSSHTSPRSQRGKIDYPPLNGMSEIHIFLAPFNPDPATVKRYDEAVADWNAKNWDKKDL